MNIEDLLGSWIEAHKMCILRLHCFKWFAFFKQLSYFRDVRLKTPRL